MTMTDRARPRAFVATVLLVAVARFMANADEPPARATFEPTDRYEVRRLEGWTVMIHQGLLADEPDLADRTLTQLRPQLTRSFAIPFRFADALLS
jgi:hypothetical protein